MASPTGWKARCSWRSTWCSGSRSSSCPRGGAGMNTLLYFVVMAAAFMGLPYVLRGVHVSGWGPAFVGAAILAVANTVVKPVLFVLTLPLTLVDRKRGVQAH